MLDTTAIRAIYNSNGLAYHSWVHIVDMLTNLETHFGYLSESSKELLQEAIKFHDIIYVPGAPDNEEKSVKVYLAHQVKTSPPETASSSPSRRALSAVPLTDVAVEEENGVVQLIMATKYHKAARALNPIQELSKIIVDLDLWGLGDSWDSYCSKGTLIRKEFLDAGIGEEQFNTGRKEFIRRFLERDTIYLTDYCQDRELRARYNLSKELYMLQMAGK